MRARKAFARRLTWVAAGALLWLILILAKLISLQVIHHHGDYARLARQQQEMKVEVIPARCAGVRSLTAIRLQPLRHEHADGNRSS